MKLRIVSDGSPSGTRVLDELGNRIENVKSISWRIAVNELSTAIIEVANTEFQTGCLPNEKPGFHVRHRWIRCVKDNVVEESEWQE